MGEAGSEKDGLRRIKGFDNFFELPKVLGVIALVVLSGQPEAGLDLDVSTIHSIKNLTVRGCRTEEVLRTLGWNTYSFSKVSLFQPSEHIKETFQEQLFVFHQDVVI